MMSCVTDHVVKRVLIDVRWTLNGNIYQPVTSCISTTVSWIRSDRVSSAVGGFKRLEGP